MVRGCENTLWRTRGNAALAQHFKRRGGSVMDEMAINIKQNLAIFAFQDAVAHPDLVEHGERFGCGVLHHAGIIPAEPGFGKRGAGVIFLSLLHGCWIMTECLFSSGTAIATSTLQKAHGQQQHGRIRNQDEHWSKGAAD
jgi:hypothetical protein